MRIFIVLIIIIVSTPTIAQQDISLYSLNNVYQQLYVNPAFLPKSKVQIGLPVISSVYVNASNTGFAFGRFIGNPDKSVDIDKVIDGLSRKNLFAVDFNTDLFSLGIKARNTYFSLSISERMSTNFSYPKDFFVLIFKGNADEELLGKRADMDGLGYNLSLYHEAALGVSFPVGDKLRIGVRGKYLMGMINVSTVKSQLGLTTSEENFSLHLDGNLALRTSGLGILNSSDDDLTKVFKERIFNPKANNGLALDFGAEYYLSDQITVTASVLNLGYINWQYDVKNYQNDHIDYTFSGVELQSLSSDDFSREINAKLDTLKEKLKFSETNTAYSSRLNPQLIGGVNLRVNEFNTIGGLVRAELIAKILRPSLSFYYQFKINHWLGLTVNYSYLNKSLVNLGGGFCVKLLPIQFYITSDNFLAPIALTTTKGVQLRAGLNLAFGGKEVRKLKVPEIDLAN